MIKFARKYISLFLILCFIIIFVNLRNQYGIAVNTDWNSIINGLKSHPFLKGNISFSPDWIKVIACNRINCSKVNNLGTWHIEVLPFYKSIFSYNGIKDYPNLKISYKANKKNEIVYSFMELDNIKEVYSSDAKYAEKYYFMKNKWGERHSKFWEYIFKLFGSVNKVSNLLMWVHPPEYGAKVLAYENVPKANFLLLRVATLDSAIFYPNDTISFEVYLNGKSVVSYTVDKSSYDNVHSINLNDELQSLANNYEFKVRSSNYHSKHVAFEAYLVNESN